MAEKIKKTRLKHIQTKLKKRFDVKVTARLIPQGLGIVLLHIPISNNLVKRIISVEVNLIWFKYWLNIKFY